LVSVLGLPLLSLTVTATAANVPEAVGVPVIVQVSLGLVVVDMLRLSPVGRPVADQLNGRVIGPLAIIRVVAV
jgi:hypothetical protein